MILEGEKNFSGRRARQGKRVQEDGRMISKR
jgi:hypothetical protein